MLKLKLRIKAKEISQWLECPIHKVPAQKHFGIENRIIYECPKEGGHEFEVRVIEEAPTNGGL